MPKYTFKCVKCESLHEVEGSIKGIIKAPVCCSKKAKRVYYPVGAVFKGSGFYQTDYRSESYKKSAASDSKPAGDSKPDSK